MFMIRAKPLIVILFLLLVSLSIYQLHHGKIQIRLRPWTSSPGNRLLTAEKVNADIGLAAYETGENSISYHREFNTTLLELVPAYTEAIMQSHNDNPLRLDCPSITTDRYDYLKKEPHSVKGKVSPKYLFALDLHQSIAVLPTLISSIIRAAQILGPGNCALSIVEGRSTDGTFEVLAALKDKLSSLGLEYFFETSDINPKNDRIKSLAKLRNLALNPYITQSDQFSDESTIIFINDIALCPEDILELIHQRKHQGADMACAMDWMYLGPDPTFYDVWIARGMTGDTFFNIPEDGNWNSAWHLFWNDPESRSRWMDGLPFQVFSCWNGITAFTAKPLLERTIEFRASAKDECFQGEPKLFCKDLWYHGHGKIAVVPSVNVGYTVPDTKRLKDLKGHVSKWISPDKDQQNISWKPDPPALVKCIPAGYDNQMFIPWNEGLET